MTPEMLENRPYHSRDADLYGAAITLFNLVTGKSPTIPKVINNHFWKTFSGEQLSSEFKDLFTSMVSYNPEDRLSIELIKAHKWYIGEASPRSKILTHEDIIIKMDQRKNDKTKVGKHTTEKEVLPDKIYSIDRALSSPRSRPNTKVSKFYTVPSGNKMINSIIEFAKTKGFCVKKSHTLYQVQLLATIDGQETHIVVNILKNNSKGTR